MDAITDVYPDRDILHGSDAQAADTLKACYREDKLEKLRDQLKRRALLIQSRIDELRGS